MESYQEKNSVNSSPNFIFNLYYLNKKYLNGSK